MFKKVGKKYNLSVKNTFKGHVGLLLLKGESHYVLIKDFNRFMYNQTLHRDKKLFCHYCLQSFINKEIIKRHANDCVEINLKQVNKMPKKVKLLNFKKMKGN